MSRIKPADTNPADSGRPSTTNASKNPFETAFDGEESDGEWWDEEDSVQSHPPKPNSAARMTRWPQTGESATAANSAKPLSRTSISNHRIDKRYSVHKPTRDKSRGRQKKQNALAGIKVVTNFAKNAVPTTGLQPSQPQYPTTLPQMGRFVDLAALQALAGEAPQPSGLFFKTTKNKETAKADTVSSNAPQSSQPTVAGRLNEHPPERLKPRTHIPSPLDLSPSDRPIVIGISIPSARLAEHALSPETATSATSNILQSYGHRMSSSLAPETPTIIITPAQATTIWSALEDNSAFPGPRPASSIYSQPPQNTIGIYTESNVPPVPKMPPSVLENERQRAAVQKSYFSPDSEEGTTWEDDDDAGRDVKSRSRAFSTGTVFEEDESPVLARRGLATSIPAEDRDTKHASISTIATHRRSKGWWNYITTPFLTRSNTVATRGVFDDRQPPALPSLSVAVAKAQEAERENKNWEKQFSPLTPETSTTMSSESWWDTTTKQARGSKIATQSPDVHESRHKVQTSAGTLPFVLSEAALLGGNTMSSFTTINSESQLDRSVSRRTDETTKTSVNVSQLSLGLVPIAAQTNHSFVQPQSGDLNPPSRNLQSVRQQVAQPSQPTAPQAAVLPSPPPPYTPASTAQTQIPRYRAVLPPSNVQSLQFPAPLPSNVQSPQYPASPGPLSPGLQQAMTSGAAIPMSDVPLTPAIRRPINLNPGYAELPPRQAQTVFDPPPLQELSSKAQKAEAKRRRHEKEDAVARRAGGWWRGRGCIPNGGCYGRTGPEGRKKRRWYFGLIIGFLAMMIVVIALATTLHRKSNTVIGPSQWLNLTGFPPIFTGLSTVAAPINLKTNTGCVFPSTQWSCDLPKELHDSVAPNLSNQPNFLLEVQWDNSSSANETFRNVTGGSKFASRNLGGNPVSAGHFIRNLLLRTRQIVTFAPNPAPPSFAEEVFLGNTTDGIVSSNKAGEPTPFYISFLSTTDSSVTKRHLLPRDSTFPNVSQAIPAPSSNSDGTAASANLLPLPFQQPIRLYDRGLPSEHYGFYTFYDRSIFLKSLTLLNDSIAGEGAVPADGNGGSLKGEARFRCTWQETRFLVQMWTRMNSTARLHQGAPPSKSASGLNFTQPGTFPYPITITADRHGGDPKRKMLYCYDMDERERMIPSEGRLMGENRAFGGLIINPAPKVFANESDPSLGGFDGGTGGCSCQWSNFQKVQVL